MALIVIEGFQEMLVISVSLHIVMHDILEISARQVNHTIVLTSPAHQLVEVSLNAFLIFDFIGDSLLCTFSTHS